MRKKIRLGYNVQKLNDIVMAHNTPTPRLWESFSWNHLPIVISIVVRIASDLLAYLLQDCKPDRLNFGNRAEPWLLIRPSS